MCIFYILNSTNIITAEINGKYTEGIVRHVAVNIRVSSQARAQIQILTDFGLSRELPVDGYMTRVAGSAYCVAHEVLAHTGWDMKLILTSPASYHPFFSKTRNSVICGALA